MSDYSTIPAGHPTGKEYATDALVLIRDASNSKKNMLELRGGFWGAEGYYRTETYLDAVDYLVAQGYRVEFSYDPCMSDAVTLVKW